MTERSEPLRLTSQDYSDTDDDADYGEDEEENDDDDDDEPQAPVRASGSTSRSQVKVPLTSMPPRGNVGRTHAYKDRKHQKVVGNLDLFL